MSVAYTGIELDHVRSKSLVNLFYQFTRLFSGNMSTTIVLHNSPGPVLVKFERNKVAPVGNIMFPQTDPNACRLERCPSGIIFRRVISEYAQVCNVRTRRHSFRYRMCPSDNAL